MAELSAGMFPITECRGYVARRCGSSPGGGSCSGSYNKGQNQTDLPLLGEY